LRIAFFTDTYLPSRDGVVTSILLTKRELEKMGHEVFVFAPEPGRGDPRDDSVHYFPSIGFKRYQGYRIPMLPTDNIPAVSHLKVDVIHAHGLFFMGLRSMLAGRGLRLPVVVTFHTMVTEAAKYYNFTPLPDETASRLMWVYVKRLLQRAEVVIAPTEAIRRELDRMAPNIRRVEVIPTGIEAGRFNPQLDGSGVRRRYGLEGMKVVLHVGRIAKEKNLDLVLNGFKLLHADLPEARLMVVGEGPAKSEYMKKAKELEIDAFTIFTGFVPDEELPFYYAACDVFTLASKFETQGIVILEAMATGRSVTGINYRAVAEVIEDGVNGYLFEENPESWVMAVKKALNAPPGIRERAVQRAGSFSTKEGTERLVEIYQTAIRSKAARLGGKIH
jgi:1,2-diacylglycerol 3-alpha-glucosyltransferase